MALLSVGDLGFFKIPLRAVDSFNFIDEETASERSRYLLKVTQLACRNTVMSSLPSVSFPLD